MALDHFFPGWEARAPQYVLSADFQEKNLLNILFEAGATPYELVRYWFEWLVASTGEATVISRSDVASYLENPEAHPFATQGPKVCIPAVKDILRVDASMRGVLVDIFRDDKRCFPLPEQVFNDIRLITGDTTTRPTTTMMGFDVIGLDPALVELRNISCILGMEWNGEVLVRCSAGMTPPSQFPPFREYEGA